MIEWTMLSFIIPAYNEEFELGRTIASIRAAAGNGRQYEIIVVDDGSTDATLEIAKAEGAVVVQIHRRQIAAARNAGAKAARGDVLFFVDADTRICAAHISDALAAIASGHSGGSAHVAVDGTIPRWAQIFLRVFSVIYFGSKLGAGAFLFTTRKNFDGVGGFDEQLFMAKRFTSASPEENRTLQTTITPILTSGRRCLDALGAKVLSHFSGFCCEAGVAARIGTTASSGMTVGARARR
jgi:hypothetical protein